MREGLYESLLTERLRQRLAEHPALAPVMDAVDEVLPHVVGARVADAVRQAVTRTRGLERRVEFIDRLFALLAEYGLDEDRLAIEDPVRVRQLAPGPGCASRPGGSTSAGPPDRPAHPGRPCQGRWGSP